jgi:predicted DNA-binding transcriptional regulator AlpA
MTGLVEALVLPDGRLAGVLDEREAAQYLGLAPGTLRNWRTAGRGPRHVRLGRRVGYRVEDLQAWTEERLIDGRGR